MEKFVPFIMLHGPLIIFLLAFADELGFPFPSEFIFLQVGALIGLGRFNFWWALAIPIAGTLLADVGLYFVGRRWGARCLRLLYRFSLEPEAVSHRRERLFGRWGLRFQLISKFLPMSMIPPVLSGMTRINFFGFLLYTTSGTVVWVTLYTAVGYLFHQQIDSVVRAASRITGTLAIVGGGLFAAYIAFKLIRRRRVLHLHYENRIAPEELKAKMDAGNSMVILDLRNRAAIQAFPFVIPGAILIPMEEITTRGHEIPAGKELILYCSCPDDTSSARVAVMLKEKGLEEVHPLSGGIETWHARCYPVEKCILPQSGMQAAGEPARAGNGPYAPEPESLRTIG
jgi:membrane protein DedA with SNARE-associated domain/rhodanese-related sulfurtransferase